MDRTSEERRTAGQLWPLEVLFVLSVLGLIAACMESSLVTGIPLWVMIAVALVTALLLGAPWLYSWLRLEKTVLSRIDTDLTTIRDNIGTAAPPNTLAAKIDTAKAAVDAITPTITTITADIATIKSDIATIKAGAALKTDLVSKLDDILGRLPKQP